MTVSAASIGVLRRNPGGGTSKAPGLGGWLQLATAPTFAALALVNAMTGPAYILCGHGMSPLGGMTLMYALMGVFHAGPWLNLLHRRHGAGRARFEFPARPRRDCHPCWIPAGAGMTSKTRSS